MIDYAFSTEAAVQDQDGNWLSLFQLDTVAIRAIRTTTVGNRTFRGRVIRIMKAGYLGEHGHPKANPKELDRILEALIKQLDEGVEVWMEK